ncbi:nucleoside 2-deoxyribosyltransferase [Candidatus Bathyarchaeota archaeon]|nr:nucleoside 2-deoxyribosyltransferase [Candidatus Bathyarchaeota archaeon]
MTAKKKIIYIAGPLFSKHERRFLEEIVVTLANKLGLDPEKDFFLPHRDAGDVGVHGEGREDKFHIDLKHLDEAKVVIALLDGPDVDSGTAVELGYAYARSKEIFGILTDWRRWSVDNKVQNINNMIWGVCKQGRHIFRKIDNELIRRLKEVIKDE